MKKEESMSFGWWLKSGMFIPMIAVVLGCGMVATRPDAGGPIDVFHADSLAGPMKAVKTAFEAKNPGVTVNLVSGRSQELAERILEGAACDVFAPSPRRS
jgi:ABC-type molybdate transport system substrate-binding protein